MSPVSKPGKYGDHVAAVQQMIRADLEPAANLAQTALDTLDAIQAQLTRDREDMQVAATDHAAKNQLREQAWARVIQAIQEGVGKDPADVDYGAHMAKVQQLITDATQANAIAEEARKKLVALQESVATGELQEAGESLAHDEANAKRISVWRQVMAQIELGL